MLKMEPFSFSRTTPSAVRKGGDSIRMTMISLGASDQMLDTLWL
jgi:hypothetical protein